MAKYNKKNAALLKIRKQQIYGYLVQIKEKLPLYLEDFIRSEI